MKNVVTPPSKRTVESMLKNATIASVAALVLAGCAGPGMKMDLVAPDDGRPVMVPGAQPNSQVELIRITPGTIEDLQSRDSKDDAAAKPRVVRGKEASYSYKIAPYDILRVTVWDHPELNTPSSIGGMTAQSSVAVVGATQSGSDFGRLVAADGTIFYPYIGMLHVAGMTTLDVRKRIEDGLRKYILNPQVEVTMAAFRSRKAYVTGQVKAPAVLPITDVPLRVSDAVLAAGGFTPNASQNQATLTRDGRPLSIDLYKMFTGGDQSQDVVLQNGDVLNIPDRRQEKVFVFGEVRRASSLEVPLGHYSLSEALAEAGGNDQITSNTGQIYVLRGAEGKIPTVYHLDASSADALVLAEHFELKSRDVVFVDSAKIARWGRVINQLLPSASLMNAAASTAK
ncbi:polysaccharide biosynthesis/export protein [Burkholderia multivorans]